jgi:hypothetical protein
LGQVFICYRHVEPDESLAEGLYQYLSARGLSVFLDKRIQVGRDWSQEIDRQLRASRYLVAFLSEHSIHSDMVLHEVEIAYDMKREGKLMILPVRVAYRDKLPYDLASYLRRIQSISWFQGDSKEKLFARIHEAIRENVSLPGAGDVRLSPPEPPPGKPKNGAATRASKPSKFAVSRKMGALLAEPTKWVTARQRVLLWSTVAVLGLLALLQVAAWGEARRLQHKLRDAPLSELFPLWKRYH